MNATDTAANLAAALRDNPGSPSTVLAAVAGIGKSTAAKLLATWEKEGFAVRNAGGKGAAAWSLAPTEAPEPEPEPAEDTPKPKVTVNKTGQERLVRGALRAEVLDWLYANPGAEVTPSKMGKTLGGRSGGACQGVLRVLTHEGVTRMTSQAPKTYALTATPQVTQ